MRGLLVIASVAAALALVLALVSGALAQAPTAPAARCEEQMRAAVVLIPRLEDSRRDAEHALAHAIATIRRLERRVTATQAELDKHAPKAPPAPSTPKAPGTP